MVRFLSSVGAMWSTEHSALLLDIVCNRVMTKYTCPWQGYAGRATVPQTRK